VPNSRSGSRDAPLGAVAIFDADSPPGLAFARSLGRAGIPVEVLSHRRFPAARLSRHASGFRRCPDLDRLDEFVPWLARELRSGRIRIVAPTSDLVAYALSETRELFPESVRAMLPLRGSMHDVLFKNELERACARIGARTPWSICPLSIDEAMERAPSLPYPVVLKPKSHVAVGLHRGMIARDPTELRKLFHPYPIPAAVGRVAEAFPSLRLPMIQEYVPDALENLFSVSGVIGPDGKIVAYAGSKKLGQWPPTLGVGLAFESWGDEDTLSQGVRIAERLLGRGLFELELIVDRRGGDQLVIDLNPRAHGQITLDLAVGNDLPLLWYQLAIGERVQPTGLARRRARWFHSLPYTAREAIACVRGPARRTRARNYLRSRLLPHVDIAFDAHDPLSSLSFWFTMLRHPGSLVRPFLREERLVRRPSRSGYRDRLAANVFRYSREDRDALLEFRKSVYSGSSYLADPAYLDWMFERAPRDADDEYALWLFKKNGRIEGQQGAYRVDLKVGDAVRRASWAFDLLVTPGHQRRGIGMVLQEAVFAENGLSLGLEVTPEARKAMLRAGWIDTGTVPIWVRPLDARRMLEPLLNTRFAPAIGRLADSVLLHADSLLQAATSAAEVRVEEVTSFDREVDRLWHRASRHYPVAVVRERAQLEWRYGAFPIKDRYRILHFFRDELLVGWAVLRVGNWHGVHAGFLVDYFCEPRETIHVLAHSLALFRRLGASAVYCLHRNPAAMGTFRSLGFVPRDSGWPLMVRATEVDDATHALLSTPSSWFITMGDSDTDRPREGTTYPSEA